MSVPHCTLDSAEEWGGALVKMETQGYRSTGRTQDESGSVLEACAGPSLYSDASRTVPIPLPPGSGHPGVLNLKSQALATIGPSAVPSWGKPFLTTTTIPQPLLHGPGTVIACDKGLFTSLSSPEY